MKRANLWQEFEAGGSGAMRLARVLVVAFCLIVLVYSGALELTWPQQLLLGVVSVGVGVWIDRSSSSYLITLTLMIASCYSTFRYAWWRIATVVHFLRDPGSAWGPIDAFFMAILLFAEVYAFCILYLGYVQTLWPLRRMPVPLPDDLEEWPAIDL